MLTALAISAGLLQALGYLLYIKLSFKGEVQPNASTWFMFAYGTALLTVLEWDRSASWQILALPLTCTTLGIVVATMCWFRGTLTWPEHLYDRLAFICDLLLTLCYLCAWSLERAGMLSEDELSVASLVFLVASNLTTFTSFLPLIRNTSASPADERFEPWLVWALAYTALGVCTYMQHGLLSVLMLYPLINAPAHGAIAWLSRPARQRSRVL